MENNIITLECEFFYDSEKAIQFLVDQQILKETLVCDFCASTMKLFTRRNDLNGKFYKCISNNCRKTKSVYCGFDFDLPKIKITKILRAAYYFLVECTNYQTMIFVGIDEKTYISLKKIFIARLGLYERLNAERIGGNGHVFQVDETAVCRRGIITNPTSLEEEVRDTVWIVGMIEENSNHLILEVLPDRRIQTFTSFFTRHLLPGSVIKSDGYPSYPQAVRNSNCTHVVINHSEGFVNENGDHTNLIENVWSHLKTELRTRRGVMFRNMQKFVEEFIIMKRNNSVRNREATSVFFMKLMRALSFN